MATSRPPRLKIRRDLWLDGRLAVWLADLRILVVADIHWGYAASHRVQGNLLPAWGDAEITARLNALISDYDPAEMIWLGDSLHTLAGQSAADAFLRSTSLLVTIVSGNHDRRWTRAAGCPSVQRAGYFLHHGDCAPTSAIPEDCVEVVGHHHPALAVHDGAGTRLKVPALVATERRLVLPAFSPWAAGAPWKTSDSGEILYGIGTKRIFTVPHAHPHKQEHA